MHERRGARTVVKGIKPGSRIGARVTVVAPVDRESANPVYLVWHHAAWAPMACKIFDSIRHAMREGALLEAVAHPNIVRFLGVERPGLLFMEFLEGPTLSSLIRSRPSARLATNDALRVAIHIGAALAHMHSRGFLHLDVKASNVIVSRGRPVLIDLGSAIAGRGARVDGPTGTEGYMAPEQYVRGPVSAAADVFGLGVTLHRMLCGVFPSPRGTSRRSLLRRAAAPPPLDRRLPLPLRRLVEQCLALDPGARPPLAELLPALHRLIRRGPCMWPSIVDI